MKFVFSFLIGILVSLQSLGQDTRLPMPLNIQKAYEAGTRSYDGNPGMNYFQNRADYQIEAEFDPESRKLTGKERVRYQNNSPRTLRNLIIRLYQNLYRAGSVSDFPLPRNARGEGMKIEAFSINGNTLSEQQMRSTLSTSGTNMNAFLPQSLEPGGSVELDISWSFVLPTGRNLRIGSYDDGHAFFVGYWYPQVAVYDDIDGWDKLQFTGLQEFYNGFGNFEVAITAPKDFIVWATGELQNAPEVLAEPFLGRFQQAMTSDTPVRIITENDLPSKNFTPDQQKLTWKFSAKQVPDFAFGMSDRYLWDGQSVVVDSSRLRRVFVEAAYPKDAEDFKEMTAIARQVVRHLSFDLPGIPFPYPQMTVFQGMDGGGMEFPMMANDASTASAVFTVSLTYHEIAHTYLPFYMGINERKYAWMDEGWASFAPADLMRKMGISHQPMRSDAMSYANFAGSETDLPLMTPSFLLEGGSYYSAVYAKAAVAFYLLQDDMGKDLFREALQEFMRRWNGKHPLPYDFFFTFDAVAGDSYEWFWRPWFFEQGYPDLGIRSQNLKGKHATIVVEKIGNLPVPIHLTVTLTNGKRKGVHLAASVWAEGNDTYDVKLKFEEEIRSVKLGNAEIPDVNPKNNVME